MVLGERMSFHFILLLISFHSHLQSSNETLPPLFQVQQISYVLNGSAAANEESPQQL